MFYILEKIKSCLFTVVPKGISLNTLRVIWIIRIPFSRDEIKS